MGSACLQDGCFARKRFLATVESMSVKTMSRLGTWGIRILALCCRRHSLLRKALTHLKGHVPSAKLGRWSRDAVGGQVGESMPVAPHVRKATQCEPAGM